MLIASCGLFEWPKAVEVIIAPLTGLVDNKLQFAVTKALQGLPQILDASLPLTSQQIEVNFSYDKFLAGTSLVHHPPGGIDDNRRIVGHGIFLFKDRPRN